MPEPNPLTFLVLTCDPETARTLERIGAGVGADVRVADDLDVTGSWDLVCLDEAHPLAAPDSIRAMRRVAAALIWIARESRGAAALAALEAGADDVWEAPLWAEGTRARVARWLAAGHGRPAAPAAGTGDGGREAHNGLRADLEAQIQDLRLLLAAQERLILLQSPGAILSSAEGGLRSLFPGAAVRAEAFDPNGGLSAEPRQQVDSPAAQDGWTRALVPLVAGGEALGLLEVRAAAGRPLSRRKLELLELYATQTAQALHRTRLYEALSRGKAEWEKTFDTIRDTISIVGPDYRLLRVNRALADLRGVEPRELVGSLCHVVLRGHLVPCPDCPVAAALETGQVAHREGVAVGGGHTFDYHAYPLRDESDQVFAVLSYARDVTREEQLARGLRRSEKLVTLGQLAAGIAHEINNPLTAVSSYAQLLGMRLEDPKLAESARRIQQGIERIHRLVRNLMSFVRPSDEDFYPLELNDIVADTLSFSRYDVTRGENELVEELASPLPRVLGSKEQLEQLLLNLLTNARDAVAGRGRITVATRAQEGAVVLEVADDGVGIPEGDVDKIFEPFYTTKPVGKGTGLGLFVAAGIVKKHRGEISLWSEPGRGTRVAVTLPAFSP